MNSMFERWNMVDNLIKKPKNVKWIDHAIQPRRKYQIRLCGWTPFKLIHHDKSLMYVTHLAEVFLKEFIKIHKKENAFTILEIKINMEGEFILEIGTVPKEWLKKEKKKKDYQPTS